MKRKYRRRHRLHPERAEEPAAKKKAKKPAAKKKAKKSAGKRKYRRRHRLHPERAEEPAAKRKSRKRHRLHPERGVPPTRVLKFTEPLDPWIEKAVSLLKRSAMRRFPKQFVPKRPLSAIYVIYFIGRRRKDKTLESADLVYIGETSKLDKRIYDHGRPATRWKGSGFHVGIVKSKYEKSREDSYEDSGERLLFEEWLGSTDIRELLAEEIESYRWSGIECPPKSRKALESGLIHWFRPPFNRTGYK